MSRISVGIVDYGIGNLASVRQCIERLGMRWRISDERWPLSLSDVVLLPGVGAFRPAMQMLRRKGLDQFLIERAAAGKPILGICLGMQLLSGGSYEDDYTEGLGIIPGEFVALDSPRWHIGWNTIENTARDPLFDETSAPFFFNHGYVYDGPEELQVCKTRIREPTAAADPARQSKDPIAAVLRRQKIVGLQFHPEKSQAAGKRLLRRVIEGICSV